MTKKELNAIRERLKNRTQGKWVACDYESDIEINNKPICKLNQFTTVWPETKGQKSNALFDAIFIAKAPTDIENLLAYVEKLEEDLRLEREGS